MTKTDGTNKNRDDELLKAIDKVQWALSETMFRAKKLKTLVADNNKTSYGFDRDLNELILALSQITQLYHHNISERIKSLLQ
jgi:hypothetical protein